MVVPVQRVISAYYFEHDHIRVHICDDMQQHFHVGPQESFAIQVSVNNKTADLPCTCMGNWT